MRDDSGFDALEPYRKPGVWLPRWMVVMFACGPWVGIAFLYARTLDAVKEASAARSMAEDARTIKQREENRLLDIQTRLVKYLRAQGIQQEDPEPVPLHEPK